MNPSREESEFVFCDLQAIARRIKETNPGAALFFLEAAYDAFEFLARNPGIGRVRDDLGFPDARSWRIKGDRSLIFYRELPDRIQIWRVLSHGARDIYRVLKE